MEKFSKMVDFDDSCDIGIIALKDRSDKLIKDFSKSKMYPVE